MAEESETVKGVLRDSETQRLTLKLYRFRFVLVPFLSIALGVFFFWDPVPWKLLWIGSLILAVVILSVVEYHRVLRNPPGLMGLQINMSVMIILQTGMIYITGGIESPLLVLYVIMSMAAGLMMPDLRRTLSIVAIPSCCTFLLALACLYSWFPRAAPAFFELSPKGWSDMPVYVWTTAGLIVLMSLATSFVSNMLRRVLSEQVKKRMEASGQAIKSLAGRNEELLSVSSTIAHELKNPLASIQGLTQLMARSVDEGSKQAERLEVMRREIVRMGEVLDGFRNFSRPLADLNLGDCDLGELVRELVLLHEGFARERSVDLLLSLEPARIRCDPQKVKQALINLIQNGLEATPAGGRVEIQVRMKAPDMAVIEIRDGGEGLGPDVRENLFEPGFSTKDDGSGIGLVVARSISEQHGGGLSLANGPRGGALATMTLARDPVSPELKGQS